MARTFKIIMMLTIVPGPLCADPPSLPASYPPMSNAAADDMAKTYAYCSGQRISVEWLSTKFPEMKTDLFNAQQQFDIRFGAAVSAIDAILTKENTRWDQGRQPFLAKLRSDTESATVSEQDARTFLREVQERSKGNLPSPFLETLLIYHPEFLREPAGEFSRGYRRTMELGGHQKAEGLSIRLQVPQSWRVDEGNHPHVVGKATSENGRGNAIAMLLVRRLPLPETYVFSKDDLDEMFGEPGIHDLLSPNMSERSSKRITLETLPGAMIEMDFHESRLEQEFVGRGVMFVVIFKNKLVFLQCMAAVPIERRGEVEMLFDRHSGVFRQIGNSIVIRDKWIQP